MSFPTITVYGLSDNEQKIRLYSNEEPVDLDGVSKVAIELNNKVEIDSVKHPEVFRIHTSTKGVMGLMLGKLWWPTSVYYGKLLIYDGVYTKGLYWGTMRLRTMENTQPIVPN